MTNREQVKCANCGKPVDPTTEEVLCDACIGRLTEIQQIIKDSCRQDVCKGLGLNCSEEKCKASACWYNEAETILAKLQPIVEQVSHAYLKGYNEAVDLMGKVNEKAIEQAVKQERDALWGQLEDTDLYEMGYRLVPELPVLDSDTQCDIADGVIEKYPKVNQNMILNLIDIVAQAQLDDVKRRIGG